MNTEGKEQKNAVQSGRRAFFRAAGRYGLTAAAMATASGTLLSSRALAQTAEEERRRKGAAKHEMTVATAYIIGASRAYPVMQTDFKENVQNFSNGEIYVNLVAGRKLGAGKALANKVQKGVIQAAQHSISNFAPFAPAVDVINIPYWCADNRSFVNLVTSAPWKELVEARVEQKGFKALFYISISARTFASRKGLDPILSPADMRGIKFRVPGSKTLQQFYRLLGANPTPVAWGETPTAIKQGVADALDPVVAALYTFGFVDILEHITLAQSVHGGQVYSCNLEWFNGLSAPLQDAVMHASDVTFRQNLAKVPAAFAFAASEMRRGGVQIHHLSGDTMAEFVEMGGYQRPEWDDFKRDAVGGLANFDRLVRASREDNLRYPVEVV